MVKEELIEKKYNEKTKEELIDIILALKEENEQNSGKYGLIWDKEKEPEEIVINCDKNVPVLERISDKDIDTGSNINHLLIEGDNYHVLSTLCYTHPESIDVIYIDPPYNRNKRDFVYNDKYIDETDGYRHSKWLNFMKKRLELAKKLLKEQGVIFISIDENECHNLKLLCDMIFGEKNYVGDFIRKTKSATNDADSFFNLQHEYCLIYKKGDFSFNGTLKDLDAYKNPDNDINGDWKSSDPSAKSGGSSTYFPIKNPITGQVDYPPKGRYWAFSEKSLEEYIKNGKVKFKNIIKEGERGFIFKSYSNQLKNTNKPIDSLMFADNLYMNQVATKEINQLDISFDYPKPIAFIRELLRACTTDSSVILDFFAGTGTTGHAVLELNNEDGGNRRFILCTNNENDICSNVTYPRLSRAINGYKEYKPLNGNLKYFRTEFVENINNRDQLKFDLTEKCIPMLYIKEDTFELVSSTDEYQIFTNKKRTKYTCVYYEMFGKLYDKFIEEIEKIDSYKALYIFSLGNVVDEEPLNNVKNYTIEPIPYKIIELYNQLVELSKEA